MITHCKSHILPSACPACHAASRPHTPSPGTTRLPTT
jgi:hypothetical protein